MTSYEEAIKKINHFFYEVCFKFSVEVKIIIFMVISIYIAVLLRAIHVIEDFSPGYEVGVGFLVFAMAFLIGPFIGALVALACIVLMAPGGSVYASGSYGWEFGVRAGALLFLAVSGGIGQHLIIWLNERIIDAQSRTPDTDLPNLTASLEYLEKIIRSSRPRGKNLDVINMRLRNIELLKEKIGRQSEVKLRRLLAQRLQEALGQGAFVGQLSDSELLGVHDGAERTIAQLCELIAEVIGQPFTLDQHEVSLDATSGILRSATDGEPINAQQLIEKTAEMAAQARKRNQKYTFLDDSTPVVSKSTSNAALQLRASMDGKEMYLLYEPRLSTRTGYFSTLEGVIRWQHPRRGDLSFDDFEVMFDDDSVLQEFSIHMLNLAFETADTWVSKGREFRLAMNASLNDLINLDVLSYITAEIDKRDFNRAWLSIELSEKALVKARGNFHLFLRDLQRKGVSVVVAGFGDGGLKLTDIFNMPVDAIKFSESAIENALMHSDKRAQLASVIKMAHSRSLLTISSGVKTGNAVRMLRSLECEEIQGSLLSVPLAADAIPWARVRV